MNKPKVIQISETLFEIPELGHSIKIQIKKGRRIFLCSCQNSARFINNNFCYDKELVLEYINTKEIRKQINSLIKEYVSYSNIKNDISIHSILNDLQNIKW